MFDTAVPTECGIQRQLDFLGQCVGASYGQEVAVFENENSVDARCCPTEDCADERHLADQALYADLPGASVLVKWYETCLCIHLGRPFWCIWSL